jgi:hypothetical protein
MISHKGLQKPIRGSCKLMSWVGENLLKCLGVAHEQQAGMVTNYGGVEDVTIPLPSRIHVT